MVLNFALPDREWVRRGIGTFAAGVTIITTRDEDGAAVGMTATAFTSVSFDPPSVLICLSRSARTQAHIRKDARYGVNLLSADAQDKSNFCAVPGQDKLLPESWLDEDPRWRTPCLTDALAFFDCTVTVAVETGTHVIIVGQIEALGLSPARDAATPLLHYRGAYRQLAPVLPGADRPLPIVFEDSLILEAHSS